jgi:serine/threonine-protein phosphatase 2A regulatory subunit B
VAERWIVFALQLCDLYENDCIFDKFDCCLSGDGQHVVTGSYSNLYRVFGVGTGNDTVLESSRDPLRRRLQAPQRSATRFGLTNRRPGNRRGKRSPNPWRDLIKAICTRV